MSTAASAQDRRAALRRFLAFATVSAIGLSIDTAIYTAGCAAGGRPGIVNLFSAAAGVTFVFFAASRRVFETSQGFLLKPFLAYALWQAFLIAAASFAVDEFTDLLDGRYLLGKAAVVPLTLTANFFVSQRLLTR